MVFKPKAWHIDPKDVRWGTSGSSTGRRKHATRTGRATCITGMELRLYHLPTAVSVKGEIAREHYSRAEMKRMQEKLYVELFIKFEKKVADFLRIAGRS